MSHPLTAHVELLFTEGDPPIPERIRQAAAAGCQGVEMWFWSDKPLDAIAETLAETGLRMDALLLEPGRRIVDPATHEDFLSSVEATAQAAGRLGAGAIILAPGLAREDASAAEQDAAVVAALKLAAPIVAEHGVRIVMEPVNAGDHPGQYLSASAHGFELVERVGDPAVRLLWDAYHSAVEGEDVEQALRGRGELIGHVHVADTEGRHEPGTGTIDWPRVLAALAAEGYTGPLGLEFTPTGESDAAVAAAREILS